MTERLQAVVAGSQGFVEALGASLRLRLGAAPKVARDPAEALRACGGAELIVLECGTPEWLSAVRDLRVQRERAACAIVATLPAVRMGEAEALRRAGADEAVPWDGRVDPVVWAVDRQVAARARAAAPPAPVVAGGRPGSAPAPGQVSTRAPAASPSRASAGLPPPVLPRPAGPSPEAAFDLREITEGAEVAAVARVGEAAQAADAALVGAGEPPLLQPIEPEVAELAPPAELPAHEAVEALLALHLRAGETPAALMGVTERVAAGLGDLERAALLGDPVGVDPAPLRRGAALRWRVTAVLARARASGLDAAAAQALPAEIDGTLAALKAAADAGPAGLLAPLSEARNALVTLAVELTEAMAAAAQPLAPAAAAEGAPARKPLARVLSNEAEAEARKRRPVLLWVAAGIALAAGVGYQLQARLGHRPGPPPAIAHAPAHTAGAVRGSGKFLTSTPGHQVDPQELERFKAVEESKGNVVVEVAPGTWVVVPAAEAAARAARKGAP